jgi:hypothetical protein
MILYAMEFTRTLLTVQDDAESRKRNVAGGESCRLHNTFR